MYNRLHIGLRISITVCCGTVNMPLTSAERSRKCREKQKADPRMNYINVCLLCDYVKRSLQYRHYALLNYRGAGCWRKMSQLMHEEI